MQRDCPSKWAYIATEDGGYVSASDVEDEYTIAPNVSGADDDHETSDEEVLGSSATVNYKTLIVQRAMSAQVEQADKLQQHNLFHTFFVVNEC